MSEVRDAENSNAVDTDVGDQITDQVTDQVADLVVVGAGPSGSSTAYHAAKWGLDVLLLDRQWFPRPKTCGDGLLPHACTEMKLMGLEDWLEGHEPALFNGYSIYGTSSALQDDSPPSKHGKEGYVVPRQETDQALLEQALGMGVRFHPGTKAESLIRDDTTGEVRGVLARPVSGATSSNGGALRFKAPLVIIADGVGGFASEGLKTRQNGVARRQYFTGFDPSDASGRSRENHVHFWMDEEIIRWGAAYGWIFHLGDGRANVGVAVYTDALARSPYNLKQFYDHFVQRPDIAKLLGGAEPDGPPESWSLKCGLEGQSRQDQGLLVVGDAAGMIHPISGEGMGYALESGRLAASWSWEAHQSNNFSADLLKGYGRAVDKLRGEHHRDGLALVKINNRFPNLDLLENLFAACETDPGARRTLAGIFYGDEPARALLEHKPVMVRTAAKVAKEAIKRAVRPAARGTGATTAKAATSNGRSNRRDNR